MFMYIPCHILFYNMIRSSLDVSNLMMKFINTICIISRLSIPQASSYFERLDTCIPTIRAPGYLYIS